MDISGSLHILSILLFSVISCCLVFSCCGYILSDRKCRKHSHLSLINQDQAVDIQEQIYTVEMPQTQSNMAEPILSHLLHIQNSQLCSETTEISLSI